MNPDEKHFETCLESGKYPRWSSKTSRKACGRAFPALGRLRSLRDDGDLSFLRARLEGARTYFLLPRSWGTTTAVVAVDVLPDASVAEYVIV